MTRADGLAGGTAFTRRRWWLLLAALAAVALVVALLVVTIREGPDRTIVGPVSAVEPHRLCVNDRVGQETCVIVDYPGRVRDLRAGDCVRMRYSAQEILVSVAAEPNGCP